MLAPKTNHLPPSPEKSTSQFTFRFRIPLLRWRAEESREQVGLTLITKLLTPMAWALLSFIVSSGASLSLSSLSFFILPIT